MLEACKEYLNTLAEGETEWRETLQSAPKHLRVGGNVSLVNEMTPAWQEAPLDKRLSIY